MENIEREICQGNEKEEDQGAVISCPPWELLNQMEFLREFVKHRK